MVNTKKAKKNVARDEVDSDVETTTVLKPTASNAASDDDDVAQKQAAKAAKKDKKPKKAKKQQRDSDSEAEAAGAAADSDIEEITKKVKSLKVKKKAAPKKAGFDLLMAGMSDDDDADEPQAAPEPESEEEEVKPTKKADKKGKKAKRGKKDDEDLDQVLAEFTAELQEEYDGGKKAEVSEEAAGEPKAKDKKKDKKKKAAAAAAAEEEANDDDADGGDENGGGGTVKTAAQKKKEKKERQKREAAEQKIQQKGGAGAEAEEEAAPKKEKAKKAKEVDVDAAAEEQTADTPAEAGDAGDKKKNKKKTKAEREAEKEAEKAEKEAAAAAKKKKGGMSAILVAAMQERLAKVKEEEEKAKRDEEERIRREEEAEDLRLENLRLEAEKKEKKKLREQERKARLKAEGKLLTAKQKHDKARAEAMLESLRAQGIELPEVGAAAADKPKPVRLGTRIRTKKTQTPAEEEAAAAAAAAEEAAKLEAEAAAAAAAAAAKSAVVEEKIKDSWDASSSEDEAAEAEPVKAAAAAKGKAPAKKTTTKKASDSDDEDSDEDSDEDDDSDDDDSDDDSDDSDEDSDDSEDSEDDKKTDAERKREKVWERIAKRRHAAEQTRTTDNLRAAVVCVLGHVDTGKTKILDKLRRTNVQDGEAGGITQQIGATNVPIDAIKEQTRIVKGFNDFTFRLPGLLIIDTPGHESFSNLRNRGSSLCDIAILVVDIMHGLEPQTIESINLLKAKKTPFIVALNKIDRLYNWDTQIRKDVRDILKLQAANTQLEFQQRTKDVVLQFAEQGLNTALFYENPDPSEYISLVPTSAITGEGMGNLLFLIVQSCQELLAKRLAYSEELLATVLEVKAIPGLGTTIDAILIGGKLREGDTMVVAGTDGPIVTQIRSLLMPQPMKELRVKNAYVEYKEIPAAQGVKIAAKELEKAIAGLNVYVANKPDEVDWCREEVAKELRSALSHIKLSGEGVYVQASTLGSLEALLDFLKSSKIPYANIRIGPVVKRDVMKASTMLVHDSQYATILAFDVKIERDAQDLADSLGVKIFQADIIYHLFDQFTAFREELKRKKREEFKNIAVFPCKLKILPQFIFNSRDPIVMGVMIEAGIVKEGTPICVPSKEFLDIGIVTSIECNHKQVETARKGQEVCIKIEPIPGESPKMYGRHFEETDILTSKISRQSIDACKDYFRDDLLKADWALMVELKKQFQIL